MTNLRLGTGDSLRAEPILNETALHALLATGRKERVRLLDFFEELALDPGRTGDFTEQSAQDRPVDVFMCEQWLVSIWVDHAVKELRIINIETVS